MSKPLGITKANQKDHNSRKNPHMAEQFAAKRKAKNAERYHQQWIDGVGWERPSLIVRAR